MTELEQLIHEQNELAPLSDEAIQKLVDNGEPPERLIEKEEQDAARRRVLQFKINALEKKQAEERRKSAGKKLAAIDAKLTKAEQQAHTAMADAWQAVGALCDAMERFKVVGDEFASLSHEAALVAREAGVNRDDSPRGLFALVNDMERNLISALETYRRPKPFNHLLIEVKQ